MKLGQDRNEWALLCEIVVLTITEHHWAVTFPLGIGTRPLARVNPRSTSQARARVKFESRTKLRVRVQLLFFSLFFYFIFVMSSGCDSLYNDSQVRVRIYVFWLLSSRSRAQILRYIFVCVAIGQEITHKTSYMTKWRVTYRMADARQTTKNKT